MPDDEISIGSIVQGGSEDGSPGRELSMLRERVALIEESANRALRREHERREILEKRVRKLENKAELIIQVGVIALSALAVSMIKKYWLEGSFFGIIAVVFSGIILFVAVRDAYRH
jgi:hypothetical protein